MTASDVSDVLEKLKTQYSEQFLQGMVARMEMSFFKYGDVADAYPSRFDALESLNERLKKYKNTKNTEFLIDVANFAMIEFMFPSIENAFFQATDSDQSPGRVTSLGICTDRPNIVKHEYRNEGD